MIITDTHTHLYAEEFDADRDLLVEQAGVLGVQRFFMPNIDSTSIEPMLELEKRYPGKAFAMMGLHPCYVKENWKTELELVEKWLNSRKFVAVGEIGIDLYWDKTFLEEQKEAFRIQIRMANERKLPIVIHTRESFDVTYELLLETKKETPQGIFHCFSGSAEQAQKAIGLGFLLGIGGVVTFKNSGVDKAIENIPLEHIVLETDAPYLAPVPYRGKRNDPAYIVKVAEKLSEIYKCSVKEIAEITTKNSIRLFGV